MMIPWNKIYSQQNGTPMGRFTAGAWAGADEKAAIAAEKKEKTPASHTPVPTPQRSVVTARVLDDGGKHFVPWLMQESVSPQEDNPKEPDLHSAVAALTSEAAAGTDAAAEAAVPQVPAPTPPPLSIRPQACLQNTKRFIRRKRPRPIASYAENSKEEGLGRDHDPDRITDFTPEAQGLLYFKKWWFLRRSGISVNGKLVNGIPICIRRNTMRVVNDGYSYIIPMKNVDYIRTCDGLRSIEKEFSDNRGTLCGL